MNTPSDSAITDAQVEKARAAHWKFWHQSSGDNDYCETEAMRRALEAYERDRELDAAQPAATVHLSAEDKIQKTLDWLQPYLDNIGAPTWAIRIASFLTGGDGFGSDTQPAAAGELPEAVAWQVTPTETGYFRLVDPDGKSYLARPDTVFNRFVKHIYEKELARADQLRAAVAG